MKENPDQLCPASELMQTELHHIRTLKIMSDVYSRGMMTELLFEQQTVEKLFPCLDELISIHSQFFQRILERKKESLVDKSEKNFLIKRMGDVLVNQVSNEKDLPPHNEVESEALGFSSHAFTS